MTNEQCARCKYAPAPGTYSTCSGDDLPVWSCGKTDDPRMPFDMEDDTFCPCFELDEKYRIDDYGDSYCPSCGGYLKTIETIVMDLGQDGYDYFETNMKCEICGKKFLRKCSRHVVIDDIEVTEIKEE